MMYDGISSGRSSGQSLQQREFEDIQHSMKRIEKLLRRGQHLLYEEEGKEPVPAHLAASRGAGARPHGKPAPGDAAGQPQRLGTKRDPAAQVAQGKAVKEEQRRTMATAPHTRQRERVANARLEAETGPDVRRRGASPLGHGGRRPTSHRHSAPVYDKEEETDSDDEFEDISIPELRERIRRELEAYRLNHHAPVAWPARADSTPQQMKRVSTQHNEATRSANVEMATPQAKPQPRSWTGVTAAINLPNNGVSPPAAPRPQPRVSPVRVSRHNPLHADHGVPVYKRLYDDAQRLQAKLQQMAARSSVGEFGSSFKSTPGEEASLNKRLLLKTSATAAPVPMLQPRVRQKVKLNEPQQRQGTHPPAATAALVERARKQSVNGVAQKVSTHVVDCRLMKSQVYPRQAERSAKKQDRGGTVQENHCDSGVRTDEFGAAVVRETKKNGKELEVVETADAAWKPEPTPNDALDAKTSPKHAQQPATTHASNAVLQSLEITSHATDESSLAQRSKESPPTAQVQIPPCVHPLNLGALRK
ncbi:hypothetical protein TraAM80_09011 [Trypanosoma rangeli]|uniref:Uncharacterized protein n=1 Tax=Trypanosoma rangeli TaxID=5698 RepID=A0A3R7JWQ2_TRYRA|nr:uncharacterized protein TraAM80_09011 [Trypanosoma rangeli]RNE98024.1 hypothetical protein TraAM80_09011 [Trypanosoma rangeli]|eukprot:RNE98024.1 hypothetical protein TraAM80_09011 [Trypanosoma rangeli]